MWDANNIEQRLSPETVEKLHGLVEQIAQLSCRVGFTLEDELQRLKDEGADCNDFMGAGMAWVGDEIKKRTQEIADETPPPVTSFVA